MPRRNVSGGDAAKGKPQRLAVENGKEPAHGANEAGAVEAGPSHGARPRNVVDGTRENPGEEIVRSAATLDDFGGNVFALGRLYEVDLMQGHTIALGKADSGARRCAGVVVGHGLWRAGDFVFDIGLLGDEAVDPGGQAAGATEGFDSDAFLEVLGG